jgi:RNA polymerase II subunit A small phosphatase-like protein
VEEGIMYVEFRPFIAEFLKAVSQLFIVYVYTAGTQPYADAVLDLLPNSSVISRRFYRESCIKYQGELIKDLKVIRNTLGALGHEKVLILVDDNQISTAFNHPYSIRVHAFQGDQKDMSLIGVYQKLLELYVHYSNPPPK